MSSRSATSRSSRRAARSRLAPDELAHSLRIASPLSTCGIFHLGGAVARVGEDETADGFTEERQRVRDSSSALEPYHAGVYVNFLMDDGAERVRQAYGEGKLRRLRALKQHYDPANVFRSNQRITPDS
ncbi:BBE domain-containing protein [Streptomyces sp. NPDC002994]|uniref:BBE domain-containing protein n=1 Tax=Streptomyces sp. NPDC002994 TaxID=3154441 RepID=UPI0033AF8790